MQLVFIHGWAFGASFWDSVAELLPDYPQYRLDLGFLGHPFCAEFFPEECVLVGHSLGFVYGMRQYRGWKACIAINSFPRFVRQDQKPGCVLPAVLRDLRIRLKTDTAGTLKRFYAMIGTMPPEGAADEERLLWGLDELRDGDVTAVLESEEQPYLVLASRHDPLVPPSVSAGMAMQSGLIWHESSSHALPQSDPQFCADHIRSFLQKQAVAA